MLYIFLSAGCAHPEIWYIFIYAGFLDPSASAVCPVQVVYRCCQVGNNLGPGEKLLIGSTRQLWPSIKFLPQIKHLLLLLFLLLFLTICSSLSPPSSLLPISILHSPSPWTPVSLYLWKSASGNGGSARVAQFKVQVLYNSTYLKLQVLYNSA